MRSTFILLGLMFIFGVSFFFGYFFSSFDNKRTLVFILFGILLSGFLLLFLYLTRSLISSSQNNFISQLSKTLLMQNSSKIDQQEIIHNIAKNVELVEHRLKPLELIIANLSLGILIFTNKKSLLEANPASGEMLGISSKSNNYRENICKSFNKYGLDVHIEKVLSGYKAKIFEVQINSDPEKWLQIETKLIINRGLSKYAVTIIQDVTRVRKLEQIRKDFVSNVSHQLKTPITSINGFLETILQNKMFKDEQGQRFLEIIYQQGHKLTGIIDDLLILSSLELSDKKKKIAVNNVDITTVIETAVDLCKNKAQIKNVPIFIECDSDIMCRINSRLIEQAIINLIDNSIKYSYEGCEVNIRVKNDKRSVVICVIDIGIGIPNDQLERIFERFYQLNTDDRITTKNGSGLGLSIAKHIAEAHDGYLTVESVLEKGSTFTLLLPK